jgi:hypothetical protein
MLPKVTGGDMTLFYGDRNGQGDVNWKPVDVPFKSWSQADVDNAGTFRGVQARRAADGDSEFIRVEVPTFKDTILEVLGRRPDQMEQAALSEKYRGFPGASLRITSKGYCYVARIRGVTFRVVARQDRDGSGRYRCMEGRWPMTALDSLEQRFYSMTSLSRLGWINCDRFVNEETYTLTQQLPAGSGLQAVVAFLVYSDINSVVRHRLTPDPEHQIQISGVPVSRPLKLIAISWKDGAAYACVKTLGAGSDTGLSLDMKQITKAEVEQLMAM